MTYILLLQLRSVRCRLLFVLDLSSFQLLLQLSMKPSQFIQLQKQEERRESVNGLKHTTALNLKTHSVKTVGFS